MGYSKTPKANYALAAQLVTVKDINAMSEFIRNFKLKYAGKKSGGRKKK